MNELLRKRNVDERSRVSEYRGGKSRKLVMAGSIATVATLYAQENAKGQATNVKDPQNGTCILFHRNPNGDEVVDNVVTVTNEAPCTLDLIKATANTGAQPVLASQESVATAVQTPTPAPLFTVATATPVVASGEWTIGGNNPSERGYGTAAGTDDVGLFVCGGILVAALFGVVIPGAKFVGSVLRGVVKTIDTGIGMFNGDGKKK